MIELNTRVEMMSRNVIAAAIHHDMWSLHIRDTAWKQTRIYRERYMNLWSVSSLAHRYSFYVRIASAYIEHRNANTVPRLRRELLDRIGPDAAIKLDAMIEEAVPVFNKVKKLRNSVYAHQSATSTIAEVYAESKMTLDDGTRLILLSMDIMNGLRAALDLAPAETNDAHIKEFFAMVATLDAGASNQGELVASLWRNRE